MPTFGKIKLPLRSYLLGNLSQDEQTLIENQLMTDSAAFEELRAVEYELIDDYSDGSLSGDEKRQFEKHFLLSPGRKNQLAFAKTLRRYIDANCQSGGGIAEPQKPRRRLHSIYRPIPAWAGAAALLLILAGFGTWAALRMRRLESALLQAAGDSQRQLTAMEAQRADLAAALQQDRRQIRELEKTASNFGSRIDSRGGLPAPIYSFALSPGLLRDAGAGRKISLPSSANFIRIKPDLPADRFPKYNAVLQRVREGVIWTQISPEPLSIIVPSQLLEPADYIMEIRGIHADGKLEEIGNYYFRVISK